MLRRWIPMQPRRGNRLPIVIRPLWPKQRRHFGYCRASVLCRPLAQFCPPQPAALICPGETPFENPRAALRIIHRPGSLGICRLMSQGFREVAPQVEADGVPIANRNKLHAPDAIRWPLLPQNLMQRGQERRSIERAFRLRPFAPCLAPRRHGVVMVPIKTRRHVPETISERVKMNAAPLGILTHRDHRPEQIPENPTNEIGPLFVRFTGWKILGKGDRPKSRSIAKNGVKFGQILPYRFSLFPVERTQLSGWIYSVVVRVVT